MSPNGKKAPLDLMAAEDVVLFTAWALGAAQAADQEDRYPCRDNQGQETSARYEPLYQCMHNRYTLSAVPT